ncbi:hypothetical protein ACFLVM_00710 [Chloroflexota bacterium]
METGTSSAIPSTAVSPSSTNAATLAFTPSATKNFLIIASALTNNSSDLYYTELWLDIDGTNYSVTQHMAVNPAENWRGFGSYQIVSLDNSLHTIKIDFRTENADGTASIKWATITAIEISGVAGTDYWADDIGAGQDPATGETSTTNTSASPVTIATITFTPAAGDYLVLATANSKSSSTSKDAIVQLTLSAADATPATSGGTYGSWAHAELLQLINTEYTFTITYWATSPETAYIKDCRLYIVPVSDLGTSSQFAIHGSGSTTETTYLATPPNATTATTKTFTPSTRNDWIILMSCLGMGNTTGYNFYTKLNIDETTDLGEYIYEMPERSIWRSAFMSRKTNLSAAEHSIYIMYHTGTDSPIKAASILEANLWAINFNTVESYSSDTYATVDDLYDTFGNVIYIWGHGLRPSKTQGYAVGYYDGTGTLGADGIKITTDDLLTSTNIGVIESSYDPSLNVGVAPGTWHAAIFDKQYGDPPVTYDLVAAAAGYVVDDAFEVQAAAIPEFPTILSAIVVSGVCFSIFYLLRRRRIVHA